jgi:hypothetical protein
VIEASVEDEPSEPAKILHPAQIGTRNITTKYPIRISKASSPIPDWKFFDIIEQNSTSVSFEQELKKSRN